MSIQGAAGLPINMQSLLNPDGSINQDAYNQLGISAFLPTPDNLGNPYADNDNNLKEVEMWDVDPANNVQTADNTITPLTQPSYSTTQDNTAFDFNNSVDKFNLQNTFQPWGNNFPDIQT